MIDRIITAYRAEIYDYSFSDLRKIFNSNRKFLIVSLVTIVFIFAMLVLGLICQILCLTGAAIMLEVITVICADRYAVKQYRRALEGRKEHLDIVAEFLRTVILEVNMYSPDRIEELVSRLSRLIEERHPFSRIGKRIKGFVNSIVLPTITFIAGICSTYLQQLNVSVVLIYGTVTIITAAFIWFATSMLLDFIRPIFCRDYDAAVSLREDLLDLQFLRFSTKSK